MTRNALPLLSLAALALLAPAARATVLFDANGFEGPTYAPGALQGQGGFGVAESSDNQFVVTNLFSQSGDQSLRVFPGPTAYATPVLDYTPGHDDKVIIETSIARNLGTTSASTTRYYGIEVYASTGLVTGFGLSAPGVPGLIQPFVTAPVDTFTGQFDPNGTNKRVSFGPAVAPNQFVNFRAELDYEHQVVDLYADGQALGLGIPFFNSTAVRTDIVSADIFRGSMTAGTGTDRAHFDTYRISTSNSAVPEPASLAILGLGVAGLARRRAKASRA